MKIAVTGANGQLGTDVVSELRRFGHDVSELNHEQIELTDGNSIRNCLSLLRPDVLINTAAAHHVEKCEERPEHSLAVNAHGPQQMARWCASNGARMIQISTDYVFDGAKSAPYDESDTPAPLNVYGESKLSGERLVLGNCDDSVVLRVSGLYGHTLCRDKGANFVDKMIELADSRDFLRVVDDEILTPTSTVEVARQIVPLLDAELTGIVHATAQGSCSWHRFAQEIFKLAEIDIDLQVAEPGEFKVKVPRPKYSVLDNRRLREAGLETLRSWEAGLRIYLAEKRVAA